MLPVQLQVRNFLSYGEPGEELDLRGIRLACISGNNGEGKSALLDAMTWALWGVARGTDLRGAGADDLIRVGADSVQVILDFAVGDDLWRVDRNRRRGRPGNLSLSRQEGNSWVSAGGATIAHTQRLINALLGLDYQTFINSAFLLQGRADEFSRQGATERKRILGDILGLGAYDELAEQAKARARAARARADALEIEVERLSEEVAKTDELRQREQELTERVQQARVVVQQAREQLRAQTEHLSRLEEAQRRTAELQQQAAKLGQQTTALRSERDSLQARLTESEQLLARADVIESGVAQLQAARAAEREWGEKAASYAALTQRREEHTVVIERERTKLRSRAGWLTEQIASLAARADTTETSKEIERQRVELTALQSRQQQALQAQQALKEGHSQQARYEERIKQLGLAQAEKSDSLALLQQAGANCPVCKGELSDERRAELTAEHRQELAELAQRAKDCTQSVAKIRALLKKQEAQVRQAQQERPRMAEVEQRLGKLEGQLAQAETARQQRDAAQTELEKIEATLQSDTFAAQARQALAVIAGEISTLGYDAAAHRASAEQVRSLAGLEAEKARLDQARALAEANREALQKASATLETLAGEESRLASELASARAEAAGLPQATARGVELQRALESSEADLGRAEQQVAVAASELARLTEAAALLLTRQKEKERALDDAVVHTDLAAAFGRNGVQALIIETALPQLEAHANELLDRLTEGRMRVSFVTQRERSGGLAETLEIRIRDGASADAAGEAAERRYEMYSGGEAFRLNFAIRLALSKLLTQRAGASLSTLVIDEGFGSQDAEGRQRLVDAILAVADDFDLILVITHLDELKAEFADRIEVWKDDDGSHVRHTAV